MVEQLKKQGNLNVLRVYQQRMPRLPGTYIGNIAFELERNRATTWKFLIDAAALGLPTDLDAARRYPDTAFSISPYVSNAIRRQVSSLQTSYVKAPLWLEIAHPAGNLPLVPWEQLLSPVLGVPLLRLPYYSLKPVPSAGRWNIVLCASSPEAKPSFDLVGFLYEFMEAIPSALQRFVTVHVFVDEAVYQQFKDDPHFQSPQWMLHNPAGAEQYGVAERITGLRDIPGNLDNPWLRWITGALNGESADVVHFLCHGYLSMGQGALAFAESPLVNRDTQWARFVGVHQLNRFLTQIGAWSVGFSSPPNNFSPPGLRLLADQIAHVRPIAVFLHDVTQDPLGIELTQAYHFLYSEGPRPLSALKAVSLYCHPSRVRQIAGELDDSEQNAILREFTLAKSPSVGLLVERSLSRSENLPAWIAASQRSLEQSAAELLEWQGRSETTTQVATRRSIESALRTAVSAIEDYYQPVRA